MKKVVQTLAKIIGSSFYLIEFLLIFFPLYYFFMLFFYLVVFLFDEGLLNLIKWEENKYAKITTQAFDSFLHLYYYFFYIISLFVAVIHVFMAGLGNYLVSKIYKDSEEKHHHHDVSAEKKEIRNGISDYVPKGRKRKALLNICKYIVVASILSFLNIYGNFLLRDYFPHTLGIELLFVLLAFGYSRIIYSHVYSYKNNKKNQEEQDFIGIPMGYGIMKSVFWGYILLFEIVSEIKVEVGV